MLVCPVCGFRNPDANTRCIRCSALLKRDEEAIRNAMDLGSKKGSEYKWQAMWQAPLERLHDLGEKYLWNVPEGVPHRFPFTAGLLSIFPGGGQFYNRQYHKGVVFFLIGSFLLLASLVTIQHPYSNFLLIGSLLAWIGMWSDAVSSAVRINGGFWSFRNSLALLFAGMFLVGITVTAAQFFGLSIITFVKARQDVHQPFIRQGDRLLVNHTAYWFSRPKLGDVIYYDPPRFTAEDTDGKNVYSINIKAYFQRVVAGPADHVQKKGNELLRNGKPVPLDHLPFGLDTLPDFELTVPNNSVFAPVTYIPQDMLAGMMVASLGGRTVTKAHEGGLVFQKWEEASCPPLENIFGRAVAIVNPPEHRQWL